MGNLRGKSCKWFLGEVFNPNKKRYQKRNSLLAFGIEYMGSPNSSVSKESTCNAGDTGDSGLIPESGRSPGGEKWQPIPVFFSEKSHRQSSLASYSPKGLKESDRTKWLSTHTAHMMLRSPILGSPRESPRKSWCTEKIWALMILSHLWSNSGNTLPPDFFCTGCYCYYNESLAV